MYLFENLCSSIFMQSQRMFFAMFFPCHPIVFFPNVRGSTVPEPAAANPDVVKISGAFRPKKNSSVRQPETKHMVILLDSEKTEQKQW